MPTEAKLKAFELAFGFSPNSTAKIEIIVDRRRVFYFILMALYECEVAEHRSPEEYERTFQRAVRLWDLAGEFDRQPSFGG